MRMSPRKKDVYPSPGYGGQQTEQAETCPRSGFAHSPTSDFLPKNSEYKYRGSPVSMVSISIRPKLGFGIGNRNQGPISVSEPKLFLFQKLLKKYCFMFVI